MRIKVKHLKEILKEYQGQSAGLSSTRTPYSYRNEFSNRFEISMHNIIQNLLEPLVKEALLAAVENSKEKLDLTKEDSTFSAQIEMAAKDMVAQYDVAFSSKMAQIARETIEKLKGGKYTEADRVSVIDMY